ncbi:hypothetical protein [Streptomyces sp. NBC_00019]|uniref:hypothetical protein n=1 Tax=Streptomyces sp. NBC_00019 TaxID=2975623 RepID=UPI00324AB6B8
MRITFGEPGAPAPLQRRQQRPHPVGCPPTPGVLLFGQPGGRLRLQLFRVGLLLFGEVPGRHLDKDDLRGGAVVAPGRVDTRQQPADLLEVARGEGILQAGEGLSPHLGLVLQPAFRVCGGKGHAGPCQPSALTFVL